MDRVENIEVLLDGQPISDAVFLSLYYNNQTNWGMGIYFDMFSNGTHQIQLRSTVRVTDQVGDTSTFVTLTNFARNITIANEVTFTNWDDLIQSSNFTFKAQTKTNETDWWIDIYDAWGNYVNGGSGHTTNAQISWTWDLTDTSSNFRDNLDSDPFFISYVTIARAGTGTQTTRHTPAAQTAYPDTGYWLISYCDKFYTDAGPRYSNGDQYYTAGIQGMEGWVTYRSIPASDFPIKFGTNSYSQQQRNDSWADLKATLFDPRYRNFYYHGHGGPSMIGGDNHTFDTNGYVTGAISYPNSKAYLTSQSVSNELTFNRHAGSRPYRFAWLDGCSTANGNWPGTFGVPKTTNALSYYTNIVSNPQHRRPSVFVGWDRIVGGNGWGSAQGHWNFNGQVFQEWSYNWQTKVLTQAFSDARHDAVWPPGGDNQLWDALRVYGYTVMRFDEYNHKTDWQWP
ncbi:MAG: hypothetical protein EPO07_09305 [Verrucomicrobia bacterium]|nr:MAG: hypothetical protein EPO07_09305 [Verrucomicrobiota bacterium]